MSEEAEGGGIVLGGGVVVRLAKDEPIDGGGGRQGLDLNGGGRRGRSFILAGLERKIHFSVQIGAAAIRQKGKESIQVLTVEEEEGLRGWTHWGDLVCSGCQRFSSGVEMEPSDDRRGQEVWVGPNFGLVILWWVWGSDLVLEVERGCQK